MLVTSSFEISLAAVYSQHLEEFLSFKALFIIT